MRCAWQVYLNLLPHWLRNDVDRLGKDMLQELRLRIGKPPELVLGKESKWLERTVSREDLQFCLNIATRYSPWTAGSLAHGFVTAMGGHRLGFCGETVVREDKPVTLSTITSVSLRVAREFMNISSGLRDLSGSTLLIGSPGCGKTTLLRDMIRMVSNDRCGAIVVVDERREIFPLCGDSFCFDTGKRTDVISGCGKREGMEMVLRSMNPRVIAVDEITSEEDCTSLLRAGWCGVQLLATAHAADRRELYTRPVYKPIVESGLFQNLIIIRKDKSWTLERMGT